LCTIRRDVVLGDRAKLNNVAVIDGSTISPNLVLQQCLMGANARIGADCNLKDCQVGPGASVPAGTRSTKKGEAFHA
jgi:carbonic anhydrase/acetyltransferase-like protein (isoleucine patch superfamily)